MKQTHDVIYVPGIGDDNPRLQAFVVNLWRLRGVRSWTVAMHWADQSETWEQKFTRLLNDIDGLLAAGHNVSLVGSSAGATAVINAFAARKNQISGVVTICGKINRPETIGDNYRYKQPAFVEAAHLAEKSLVKLGTSERHRMLSIYSKKDGVVDRQDSLIDGAYNKEVASSGHSLTIGLQLLFGATSFIKFLKRTAR